MPTINANHSKTPGKRRSGAPACGPPARPGENTARLMITPHHRRRDRGQRCGEFDVVARSLDRRTTNQDEQERRQKGEEGRHQRTGDAAEGQAGPGRTPAWSSHR